MENRQPPANAGKQPFIEPEPKTLTKEQYKQSQAAAVAQMHSLIFQTKLERRISNGEASTSATKPDEAGTELKVPFPWPA
ncbi:hypothetical protein DITRI_Ditri03aG0141800 [Diplodiscus trichospermus]